MSSMEQHAVTRPGLGEGGFHAKVPLDLSKELLSCWKNLRVS